MKNNIRPTLIFLVIAFFLVISITFLANNSSKNSDSGSTEKIPAKTETGGAYTLEDVAKHSSASDCWAIVQTKVYDLTTWINKHPGGSQAIAGLCGKDGTTAFESQHGGQPNPEKVLASFEVGTYKK